MPGFQERRSQYQAPGKIWIRIENVDCSRLEECGRHRAIVNLSWTCLLPPLSIARCRKIEKQNAPSCLEEPARCHGDAVQYEQHQQHNRAITEKRREGCRQRSHPAPLCDTGQKICLKRTWLNGRGESETACDDEVFEHSSELPTYESNRAVQWPVPGCCWAGHERVLSVARRQEFPMQRHPCEWTADGGLPHRKPAAPGQVKIGGARRLTRPEMSEHLPHVVHSPPDPVNGRSAGSADRDRSPANILITAA